jgi:hypothetical protein
MILRNIDGIEIQDVDFNVFVNFFTDHMFFKFMDSGRSGIVSGYKDLVDNTVFRAEKLYEKRGLTAATPKRFKDQTLYEVIYHDGLPRVIDGFIKSGTEGMRTAVFQVASDPRLFNA